MISYIPSEIAVKTKPVRQVSLVNFPMRSISIIGVFDKNFINDFIAICIVFQVVD